jgi:hypothetical protein
MHFLYAHDKTKGGPNALRCYFIMWNTTAFPQNPKEPLPKIAQQQLCIGPVVILIGTVSNLVFNIVMDFLWGIFFPVLIWSVICQSSVLWLWRPWRRIMFFTIGWLFSRFGCASNSKKAITQRRGRSGSRLGRSGSRTTGIYRLFKAFPVTTRKLRSTITLSTLPNSYKAMPLLLTKEMGWLSTSRN